MHCGYLLAWRISTGTLLSKTHRIHRSNCPHGYPWGYPSKLPRGKDINMNIRTLWPFTWISIQISVRMSVSNYPCNHGYPQKTALLNTKHRYPYGYQCSEYQSAKFTMDIGGCTDNSIRTSVTNIRSDIQADIRTDSSATARRVEKQVQIRIRKCVSCSIGRADIKRRLIRECRLTFWHTVDESINSSVFSKIFIAL